MKPSHLFGITMKQANETVSSPLEAKRELHIFSDQEWMAIRHSQMDVASNCIFPARERKSVAQYLATIGAVLIAFVKLPVRI